MCAASATRTPTRTSWTSSASRRAAARSRWRAWKRAARRKRAACARATAARHRRQEGRQRERFHRLRQNACRQARDAYRRARRRQGAPGRLQDGASCRTPARCRERPPGRPYRRGAREPVADRRRALRTGRKSAPRREPHLGHQRVFAAHVRADDRRRGIAQEPLGAGDHRRLRRKERAPRIVRLRLVSRARQHQSRRVELVTDSGIGRWASVILFG